MNYHPITEKITSLLKEHDCWFETFEHEEVRTSEEAAKTRPGYTQHQGAKAIIVRVKMSGSKSPDLLPNVSGSDQRSDPTLNKKFVMLVFPADMRFSNEKVKILFNAKDIRFATEDEINEITNGVQPGGVPPFGNLFNLEVIVDVGLFENEKIVFNAGDRRFSVAMLSEDYKELVKPQIVEIV